MKQKIEKYIKDWESKGYSDGIPDEVPLRLSQLKLAPSNKDICITILKNDVSLKSLGFQPKRSRYYHLLKKAELDQRGDRIQLDFFNLLTIKINDYDKL